MCVVAVWGIRKLRSRLRLEVNFLNFSLEPWIKKVFKLRKLESFLIQGLRESVNFLKLLILPFERICILCTVDLNFGWMGFELLDVSVGNTKKCHWNYKDLSWTFQLMCFLGFHPPPLNNLLLGINQNLDRMLTLDTTKNVKCFGSSSSFYLFKKFYIGFVWNNWWLHGWSKMMKFF